MFAEAECKITTPLKDVETQEGNTVSLVVEISKPRKVTWKKGGKPLQESDRFKIEVREHP